MTAAGEPLARADSALVHALVPSPNHGERPEGVAPDCLVLHYTGMADGPSAVRWLCEPVSQVSCHYVVEENGRILQLVGEERRAWHAGRSFWAGATDLNSLSIGVEIVNAGHPGGLPPYPEAQIDAVIALCGDLTLRHAIAPDRVLAHSDIAPGRKQDPGEHFPWGRLAQAGVGLWVPAHGPTEGSEPVSVDGEALAVVQAGLADFGYGLAITGMSDAATAMVVRAFQLHFRQSRVDGVADRGTARTLRDLLAAREALSG